MPQKQPPTETLMDERMLKANVRFTRCFHMKVKAQGPVCEVLIADCKSRKPQFHLLLSFIFFFLVPFNFEFILQSHNLMVLSNIQLSSLPSSGHFYSMLFTLVCDSSSRLIPLLPWFSSSHLLESRREQMRKSKEPTWIPRAGMSDWLN